jgi:predicted RNase H-like nuclease (RuvC/YqgF family)
MRIALFILSAGISLLSVTASASPRYGDQGQDRSRDREERNDRDARRAGDPHFRVNYVNPQLQGLERRIRSLANRGELSRREMESLRSALARLWDLDRRFRPAGYTWREQQEMRERVESLRNEVRYERRDNDRRYR